MRVTSDLESQIAELERHITDKRRELVELKKQAGRQEIDEYTLQGPDGPVALEYDKRD